MQLFLTLLLAHLFADFPLQSNALVRFKGKHLTGVLLHATIYTTVTASLLGQWLPYWPLVVGLGGIHFAIDAVKSRLASNTEEIRTFLLDQLLHLISLLIATLFTHSYWQIVPAGIVPVCWLPIVLFAAFLPALMVGYWIWATSSGHNYVKDNHWLHQLYGHALAIEQRFGLVLLLLIFVAFIR